MINFDDPDDEVDEVTDLANDASPEDDKKLGGEQHEQPMLVQLLRAMLDQNPEQYWSQQQMQKDMSEESIEQ